MSVTAYMKNAGLVTKVRALYGKRLSEADFAALRGMSSVEEIYVFLRDHPGWSTGMQALAQGFPGRLEVEKALYGELIAEYHAIGHFVAAGDKKLWGFLEHLQDLMRIMHGFRSYQTVEDLRQAAAGTIYVKNVAHATQSGLLPDYPALETLLRTRYYVYLYRQAMSSSGRVQLQRMLGESVDYINLLNLLRIKHYFPANSAEIARYIPVHHRLNRKLFIKMTTAADYEDANELLRQSPTLGYLAELNPQQTEKKTQEALLKLFRRVITTAEPSVAVGYAYICYKEMMLSAIYSIIESVKYEQTTKIGGD